ncbi:MAG TPA: glycine zipper 2TM domain-containing protein [Rhodocyclaceae bacterium]|nr:glycine zipper 2TM domain-containing protein [Rhodocyclaceae bacterium]
MDTHQTYRDMRPDNLSPRADAGGRLHPVIWVAAGAVTLAGLTVAASFSGLLPARQAPAAQALSAPTPAVSPTGPSLAPSVAAPGPTPPVQVIVNPAPAVRAVPHSAAGAAPSATVVSKRPPARSVVTSGTSRDTGIDVTDATPAPAPRADGRYEDTREPSWNPRREPDFRTTSYCADCGVVQAVRPIRRGENASGLGAAVGGVVGGLLGNQVGAGKGRDLATIVGIAGGAYAGHQIEKSQRATQAYEVSVRMRDGTTQTLTTDEPNWRAGDPVRLENGRLLPG